MGIEIPVSKEAVEHGLAIGKKVFLDKAGFSDKFVVSNANALQADIYGFIAESVVCGHFGQPLPALLTKKIDSYDLMLGGKRVDVKKVGFSKYTGKPKITIDKRQFDRKKDKVDAFLFCTFKGHFEQISSGIKGYKVWLPTPVLNLLCLIGWIPTEEVEARARTYVWKNLDGSVRNESWQLYEERLHDLEELIG